MSGVPAGRQPSRPWPLVLILLVFGLLALVYSLTLPLGESSDATSHFALVRFIAEHGRPPLSAEERHAVGVKGDAAPFYHGLVALLTQHVDVDGVTHLPEVLLKSERSIPDDGRINKKIFHTENEAFPFHGFALAWHLARLPSIPLGMAMIVAVYLVILAIYPARPMLAIAGAAFVAFTPRFIISSAVINDDNLIWPLITFALYFLIRIAQGDVRRRNLILLGVLIGGAALVKYHSVVLLPQVTLLLAALALKNRWSWRQALAYWGWCVGAFTVTFGWWLLFVLIRFNEIAELGLIAGLLATLGDPVIAFGTEAVLEAGGTQLGGANWGEWLVLTFRTFWLDYGGIYGGLQATGKLAPYQAVYGLLALVTLAAGLGLLGAGWRYLAAWRRQSPHPWPRLDLAVLALHLSIYLVLVLVRRIMLPLPSTAQGRHLFPALAAIALFFVLGLGETLSVLKQQLGRFLSPAWQRHPLSDATLAQIITGGLLSFSLVALPLFIWPVYYPYLPLRTVEPDEAAIPHRTEVTFAPGLQLVGFDAVSQSQSGEPVAVTLYWYAGAEQTRDYLVQLCLHDGQDRPVTCHLGHPVDGRYPMRAWETGYLIRDEIVMPTPACLAGGPYQLTMSLLPLRLDTPFSRIDETVAAPPPLNLGTVTLSAGRDSGGDRFALWLGDRSYSRGRLVVRQLRGSLTMIDYRAAGDLAVEGGALEPVGGSGTGTPLWPAVEITTTHCQDGTVATTRSFIVDPGVRPGAYRLNLGRFAQSQFRVQVATRERNFSVPSLVSERVDIPFGGVVKLLGYELDLSPRLPGETIDIRVYWQALQTMSERYSGTFHLLDNNMVMWSQFDRPLGQPYPNLLWAPGEVVSESYPLQVGPHLSPGLYTLEFSVYNYRQGSFEFLPLGLDGDQPQEHFIAGRIRVLDPARSRPPQHPMLVTLNGQVQFLGSDLSAETLSREMPLQLALHWQAVTPLETDYTVFTQLIGPDNQVWGQFDSQPQGGRFPTSSWSPADRVVDRYQLSLQAGAPAGQYRLLVGMYDLTTGLRLPAFNAAGDRLPDDAIQLATLTLE